jgi:heat shock protein HtpX
MANLYVQAESNTRKTWLFMLFFFLLVIGFGWLLSYIMGRSDILYFAVVVSILTSFGSYWYSDKVVLSMTNALPIEKKDNPELYRLVENLCITAGLPLPRIYILDEKQPNAFATGRDAKHAVIVVTRGLLEKLNKSELEGVIGHELSHIGNKDMLLQTVVVIMAGMIALASNWFLRIGLRRGNDSEGSKNSLVFFAGIMAAILAPLAASLIKMSISRKREFLADASGALLTRYPEGLARALEKISSDPNALNVSNDAVAHLFIAEPKREELNWFSKLFLTHPPIEERIQALREMEV